MRNRLGFGLIELIVVIVVIGFIAFIVVENFNGKDEDGKSVPDKVEEARDASNAIAVERYAKSVETAVVSYSTMNPDVNDIIISVDGNKNNSCHIDATTVAVETGTTTCTQFNAKALQYSGPIVICQNATFDSHTGRVVVTRCSVGNSKDTYSWNTGSSSGAQKDS